MPPLFVHYAYAGCNGDEAQAFEFSSRVSWCFVVRVGTELMDECMVWWVYYDGMFSYWMCEYLPSLSCSDCVRIGGPSDEIRASDRFTRTPQQYN